MLKALGWIAVKVLIRLRFPGVKRLSTKQLANWLEQDKQPLLLDARTAEEYAASHLSTARLVPAQLELADWEAVKPSTPIVVYCSIGYRSARLAQQLEAMGYKNAFNLEGSIFEWANEGYPVYQGDTKAKHVHPFNQTWGTLLKQELYPRQWQPIELGNGEKQER